MFTDHVKMDKILFVGELWLFLGDGQMLEQASSTTCIRILEDKRDVHSIFPF